MADDKPTVIEHRAYSRVGFLGNPSDVYYGRTLSFTLANFQATVKLEPSEELVIVPHPTHDLVHFNSLVHLVSPSLQFLLLWLYLGHWTLDATICVDFLANPSALGFARWCDCKCLICWIVVVIFPLDHYIILMLICLPIDLHLDLTFWLIVLIAIARAFILLLMDIICIRWKLKMNWWFIVLKLNCIFLLLPINVIWCRLIDCKAMAIMEECVCLWRFAKSFMGIARIMASVYAKKILSCHMIQTFLARYSLCCFVFSSLLYGLCST